MGLAVEGRRGCDVVPVEPQTASILRKEPDSEGSVHGPRWIPGLLWGFPALPPPQTIRVSDVEVNFRFVFSV